MPPHNDDKEAPTEATSFTLASAAASETCLDLIVFLVVFNFSNLSLRSSPHAIVLTECINRETILSTIKIFSLISRRTRRKMIQGDHPQNWDLIPWPRTPTPPSLETGEEFKQSVEVKQLSRSLTTALRFWRMTVRDARIIKKSRQRFAFWVHREATIGMQGHGQPEERDSMVGKTKRR